MAQLQQVGQHYQRALTLLGIRQRLKADQKERGLAHVVLQDQMQEGLHLLRMRMCVKNNLACLQLHECLSEGSECCKTAHMTVPESLVTNPHLELHPYQKMLTVVAKLLHLPSQRAGGLESRGQAASVGGQKGGGQEGLLHGCRRLKMSDL